MIRVQPCRSCILIFEGEIKQRSFRKWGSRICETSGEAKETLGRAKMDSLWGLERSTERPGLVCVTDDEDMSGEAAALKLGDCNGKTK